MCVSGGKCPKVKKEKIDIIYVKYNKNTILCNLLEIKYTKYT